MTPTFGHTPGATSLRGPDSDAMVFARLADTDRMTKLIAAVDETVRPGDRVVQIGAGAGVLALAAARAGADVVDAYEPSPLVAAAARRNITANDGSTVVQVIEDDIVSCTFAGPYDVVIAAPNTVGLIDEPLLLAMNNLFGQRVLAPDARVIPESQSTFIELVQAHDNLYSFDLAMIQHEQTWQSRRVRDTMTELRLVSHPDFSTAAQRGQMVDERVLAMIDIRVLHSGRADALRLTSMSHLAPGIDLGWTQCTNIPALVPVQPRDLIVGNSVGVDVSYRMGAGFASLRFDWSDDSTLDINRV